MHDYCKRPKRASNVTPFERYGKSTREEARRREPGGGRGQVGGVYKGRTYGTVLPDRVIDEANMAFPCEHVTGMAYEARDWADAYHRCCV